jgi:predicted PurR-regulated permease PerM
VAGAILHTIPYLGAAALAAAAGLAAYVQLGSIGSALVAIGVVLAIAGALGVGLQTWLMGRAARMNAPAVFISLLFWGMLWGAWGLLLAVPIMVAVKTACDHIEWLHGWGALLGP